MRPFAATEPAKLTVEHVMASSALPMLLRRFPKLALAGPPRTLDLLTFHGYKEIAVTIS